MSLAWQMTEQTAVDGHCQHTDCQQVHCRRQHGSAAADADCEAASRMSTSRRALAGSLIGRLRGSSSSKAAAARGQTTALGRSTARGQTVSDSGALRRQQQTDARCQPNDAIATAGIDALTLSHRSNFQHSAESAHKLVSYCSFLFAPSNNCNLYM